MNNNSNGKYAFLLTSIEDNYFCFSYIAFCYLGVFIAL